MIRSLDSQNKGNLVTLLVTLTKYLLEQLKGDACFHIVKGEAGHQRRQRVKTGARGATSGGENKTQVWLGSSLPLSRREADRKWARF